MKIADQPLLPARYRAPALGVALVTVAAVVALGIHYAGQVDAGGFDRAVDGWFVGQLDTRTAVWLADIGNPPVVAAAVLLVAAGCALVRLWRGAVLAVAAPAFTSILTEWVIKPAVGRTKGGGLAYPSGHTVGTLTLALAITLLVCGPGRQVLSRGAAAVIAFAAVALSVLCMIGLIAADYHYATDVIGGICLSIAGTCLVALAIDRSWPRLVRTGVV